VECVALAPTLHTFQVDLHHVDRQVEQSFQVRVAQHPSETLERLWLRLLAYCWAWEERLAFGKGLSEPDEPDLLATDLTGQLTQWIRVGKAEAAKVQRLLDRNRSARVTVFFDSRVRTDDFLANAAAGELSRAERLELLAIEPALVQALAAEEGRRGKLVVTLVGDHFYVERDGHAFDGAVTRIALP
jgi:uncharacterized protein YaeQ